MKITKDSKVLIVGLGLMGGSYAKALTKRGYKVTAISDNSESISYGLEHGMICGGYDHVEESVVRAADIVVFALYPEVFLDWISQYRDFLNPDALVTDISGVKQCVVYKAQEIIGKRAHFVSSHPMAGRERSGVEHSDDSVFDGANYIVVPTAENTPDEIEACKTLGAELGFGRISELSAEEHDAMIAFLSQLTHCIAVSLMTCTDNEHLVSYTGDSFRDLTRIAKINDVMWSGLFNLNMDSLVKYMDLFAHEFEELRNMVASGDIEGMRRKMRLSTKRRALFDK